MGYTISKRIEVFGILDDSQNAMLKSLLSEGWILARIIPTNKSSDGIPIYELLIGRSWE